MRPKTTAIVECWEHLHEAVLELATRCASPRQRLLAVAQDQLLAVAELGVELRDADLRAWIERLTRRLHGTYNRPTRCSAFAAVNAMSDEDVDAAIMEIVVIYDEITRCELMERLREVA